MYDIDDKTVCSILHHDHNKNTSWTEL